MLDDLGVHLLRNGRVADAVSPSEEAVSLRRQLADTDPALTPRLAHSPNNLGIIYLRAGRVKDAAPVLEQAVERCS